MIIGQSIFQLTVALVLHFAGAKILGYNATDTYTRLQQTDNLNTLVFNQFVWCQIFNQLNARRLDRKTERFQRLLEKLLLHGDLCYQYVEPDFQRLSTDIKCFPTQVAGGQALIVNVGGTAFQVTRIGGNLWAISIIIGLISLPVGVLVRLLPTAPFERALIRCKLLPDPNALPLVSPEAEEQKWDAPLEQLRDNLRAYARLRGGRLRSSSIVQNSRMKRLERDHIYPTTLMAMVPSVIAGSWVGFRPSATLANPAAMEPSRSSTALYRGAAAMHPDTDAGDVLAQRFLRADAPMPERAAGLPTIGANDTRSPTEKV